jgi:O-antigen ligase
MSKYSFLALIYLISVVSSSIANSTGTDVQILYRVPFLNLRWIDIAILIIVFGYFYSLTTSKKRLKNTNYIIFLCYIYLLLESVQLIRSWGRNDTTTQVSLFFSTFSLFIVIDLSTYALPIDRILLFLRRFAVWGAFAIMLTNFYLLYAFFFGHVRTEDMDIRVALDVVGSKETVYSFILTPFVYAFGLYFMKRQKYLQEKLLFLLSILSIYGALVITFWRGTLVMVFVVTLYFLVSTAKAKHIIFKSAGIVFFIGVAYFLFGGALAKKGYDPIKQIVKTAEFATDIKNPEWEKGRRLPQEYALKAWENNFWIGAGYDKLEHYGLPSDESMPHNGIIDLLFHGGIIGAFVYISILLLLFKNALKLWQYVKTNSSYQNEMIKLLILVSFLWIITFLTQEALWEKYSLSLELLFLGLITNVYKQIDDPQYFFN